MPKRRSSKGWRTPAYDPVKIAPRIGKKIRAHHMRIIPELKAESIEVYLFLAAEYAKGSVDTNSVFQFVYRSYYRLDNAGLSDPFKKKYFKQMEAAPRGGEPDLRAIARGQKHLAKLNGILSLQFSFLTKLGATVNPDYPIYDDDVGEALGVLPYQSIREWDNRLTRTMDFYDWFRCLYTALLSEKDVIAAIAALKKRHPRATPLTNTKALDFLFWQAGKLGISLGP